MSTFQRLFNLKGKLHFASMPCFLPFFVIWFHRNISVKGHRESLKRTIKQNRNSDHFYLQHVESCPKNQSRHVCASGTNQCRTWSCQRKSRGWLQRTEDRFISLITIFQICNDELLIYFEEAFVFVWKITKLSAHIKSATEN